MSCRQAFADLKETSILISSLPEIPVPAGFREELHERLIQVNQEMYPRKEGGFGVILRFFKSYRLAPALLIVFFCFIAYGFSILHKNTITSDQAPAAMNVEIAMEKAEDLSAMKQAEVFSAMEQPESRSPMEQEETQPVKEQADDQAAMGAGEMSVNQSEESRSPLNRNMGLAVFALVLGAAILFYIGKNFSKMRS